MNRTASFTASEQPEVSSFASSPASSSAGRNLAWVGGGTSICRFGPLAGFAISRWPLSIAHWQTRSMHDKREFRRRGRVDHRRGDGRRLPHGHLRHRQSPYPGKDVLAHRVVPPVALVRQPVVRHRRRKALPAQVFVVRLGERQRTARPMPRIEAALGEGTVVRRNAPGLLKRNVRVSTQPQVEPPAVYAHHLRPRARTALLHHEIESVPVPVTAGRQVRDGLGVEFQRCLHVVEERHPSYASGAYDYNKSVTIMPLTFHCGPSRLGSCRV